MEVVEEDDAQGTEVHATLGTAAVTDITTNHGSALASNI
jgi:hypothetical protein